MTRLDDDATLVRLAVDGDQKAFELLVRKHHRYAGAVAMGVVGDYHAAKDVLQEAYVKIFEALARLEDRQRYRPWLRHIVINTARDHLRRKKVAGRSGEALPGQDEESEPLPAPGLSPEEVLAQDEMRERIRREIARLPETQREVVYLKYLQGLSYEEIAEATELSIATIESRLFRARQRLKGQLSARFGPPSGDA